MVSYRFGKWIRDGQGPFRTAGVSPLGFRYVRFVDTMVVCSARGCYFK